MLSRSCQCQDDQAICSPHGWTLSPILPQTFVQILSSFFFLVAINIEQLKFSFHSKVFANLTTLSTQPIGGNGNQGSFWWRLSGWLLLQWLQCCQKFDTASRLRYSAFSNYQPFTLHTFFVASFEPMVSTCNCTAVHTCKMAAPTTPLKLQNVDKSPPPPKKKKKKMVNTQTSFDQKYYRSTLLCFIGWVLWKCWSAKCLCFAIALQSS